MVDRVVMAAEPLAKHTDNNPAFSSEIRLRLTSLPPVEMNELKITAVNCAHCNELAQVVVMNNVISSFRRWA